MVTNTGPDVETQMVFYAVKGIFMPVAGGDNDH
jgi:hypothetical protein